MTRAAAIAIQAHRAPGAGSRVVALAMALLAAPVVTSASELHVRGLYDLSSFEGTVGTTWGALAKDAATGEIHVTDVESGIVHVFTNVGMEVFTYGNDGVLPPVRGVAILPSGDLLVLPSTARVEIIRCNYRAEPIGKIELSAGTDGFRPTTIAARKGQVYLADLNTGRVIVAREDGTVVAQFTVADALRLSAKQRASAGLGGFNVDRDGNILFTIPALFLAGVLSLNGEARTFGDPGSTPGHFNIAGGIAGDDEGRIWIVDSLRAVVMVFDQGFSFLDEFGGRDYFAAPRELAVTGDKIFISQARNAGTRVVRVTWF